MIKAISKGRLNSLLSYFEGKDVFIMFEYNNSLGHHNIIKYKGKYDQFTIEVVEFSYSTHYVFKLLLKKEIVFELDLPGHAEFHGLGRIRYINDGPSCYFEIGYL